jgi:curved DNA-binding protein
MAEDLYVTLGVPKTASEDQIRQAYRRLARKHHPDVNPGDKKAEDRFKKVSAAYEVLSDREKRKLYDEFGEDSLRGGFNAEQARAYQRWSDARGSSGAASDVPFEYDFGDLGGLGDLGELFRRGRRGGGRGRGRGRDMTADVLLDFVEALRGTTVDLTSPTGGEPTRIRIPPGTDDGTELRVRGKGMPGAGGGEPGDLIIRTRVRPHPHFKREGLDLHLRLPVTVEEAYLGATVDVPTPDGPVRLKVPARSQPGTKLRLAGKGVERKDRRGDMYVELDVRVPDVEDAKLADALADTGRLYRHPVREGIHL